MVSGMVRTKCPLPARHPEQPAGIEPDDCIYLSSSACTQHKAHTGLQASDGNSSRPLFCVAGSSHGDCKSRKSKAACSTGKDEAGKQSSYRQRRRFSGLNASVGTSAPPIDCQNNALFPGRDISGQFQHSADVIVTAEVVVSAFISAVRISLCVPY